MTHDDVVKSINDVLKRYTAAVKYLQQQETIPSFRALFQTSQLVKEAFHRAVAVSNNQRVAEKCSGKINCAIIGSSGHGKTTMLDEMFPGLSERGLLVTDVTDTTSQALHISFGKTQEDLNEVFVNSWNHEQITVLMSDEDVRQQNKTDNINVDYLPDRLVVDGSSARLPNMKSFKFPLQMELQPFPHSYRVPAEKLADGAFIRALTVKQTSDAIDSGTVLAFDGLAYNALQLRAIVKEVKLKDRYENIFKWSKRTPQEVIRLQFVDTPGISVQGSEKDEILRHFLGKKSNHIALQMWMNDELDIIVHVVLCGRGSDFAELWKTLESNCEPGQMSDFSERLVLAVNGMNRYFSDKNLIDKYENPENAQAGGDHFATTIEDNILQKMSPRGRVKPARICFFDSKQIVEADKRRSYADYYEECRAIMEKWAEPSGVGHSTLASLGLVESFRKNIQALVDPEDRGMGYLVRQLFEVVDEKGPYLLVKKYLVRTKLFTEIEHLLDMLETYYDDQGFLNREAVLAALRSCLSFLEGDDPLSVERFSVEQIDPEINSFDFREAKMNPDGWGKECFLRMGDWVKRKILANGEPPDDIANEFSRHFDSQLENWSVRWGYDDLKLPPPSIGSSSSSDLMRYCLKLHAREIILKLLTENEPSEGDGGIQQSEQDQKKILQIIEWLREAQLMTQKLCAAHGVSL
jgi:hypothetical protein